MVTGTTGDDPIQEEVRFGALVLCIKPTLSPPIKESYD
jgi:hypothetical protein